jgi:3-phenylpropionate/cinnamic acid dioxygenase small subunit
MDVWEVIARESIRDLVTRYNANGDSGRFDNVIALFADDAVMELEGEDGPDLYRGHDEILSVFTGTRDRWADELGGEEPSAAPDHYIRHRVATHQIDFDGDTHARGYCYYQVVMPHGLDHWGRYFDRYEQSDGRWLFTHRRVTVEGRTERT